jgi:arsenical pump membrane protein
METGPWIWLVAGSATAAVILRPFRLPEAIWAASGVLILLVFHLLPFAQAMAGVRRGTSVYLFLAGMMLMAELARRERLHVGVGQFFKLGLLVMPPTLLLALFVLHGIA